MNFLTSLVPEPAANYIKNKGKRKEDQLTPFLETYLPIFWMTGPNGCGKKKLGRMLSKTSNYTLINVPVLLVKEARKRTSRGKCINEFLSKVGCIPDDIVIKLLGEVFMDTYENAVGYILLGFPMSLQQAQYFERKICKVNLIIFVTSNALLRNKTRRKIGGQEEEHRKMLLQYEQKTIIIPSEHHIEDTHKRLVNNLTDFWGYSFHRL